MKFIKLTECNGNDKTLIINTAKIEHIQKGKKAQDTYIKMVNDKDKDNYFFVKETVEEIWAMLNIGQNVTYDADKSF